MTPAEPAATFTPTATPLATLAGTETPTAPIAVYRGALTPCQLDEPEREIAALVSGGALHDLGWMRRFAVTGEDRFRWLSGMVSNTVSDLPTNAGAWNLVLNAQGRIQGDLWVWRDGDSVEIEIEAEQQDKLLTHLNHFIIMDDVELTEIEGQTAIGLTGPRADEFLGLAGLPRASEPLTQIRTDWNGAPVTVRRSYGVLAPHYELWATISAIQSLWKALIGTGATPIGAFSLEAFRLTEGIPSYGIDIAERDLAQETSQTRALCFTKGCYLGQEIVERIRSRGAVHRHLRHLELTGPLPAPGTELQSDSLSGTEASEKRRPAGHITSAAELRAGRGNRTFALAMVRAEAELDGTVLTYRTEAGPGTARIIASPPELQPDFIGSNRS